MYKIFHNRFNLPEKQLFYVGKRDRNEKRNFLFISKLLGKHIAVSPDVVKASGYLLSSLKYGFENKSYISCIEGLGVPSYCERADDSNILVIGFCETATALGMSVASSIKGSDYITTTREQIIGIKNLLKFEEQHSHASTHCMYSDSLHFNNYKEIIFVDDEITTGQSLLNIIAEIVKICSIRKFSILTILDWRNDEMRRYFKDYSSKIKAEITVYSLLDGNIKHTSNTIYCNSELTYVNTETTANSLNIFRRMMVPTINNATTSYVVQTGRFGVNSNDIDEVEELSRIAAHRIAGTIGNVTNIIVLGHGENIYIPSRIAAYLFKMGYKVAFKTTSRTPIYCDGEIIKDAVVFYDRGIKYHFYNRVEAEEYDKVIMITETQFTKKICNNLIVFNL